MNSGVYKISSPSGKCYVGSAVDFQRRWRVHRHHLRRGTHDNRLLQNAWNKYGGLKFSKLLVCAPADVVFYEQLAIDALQPAYNVLRVAGSSLGFRHTPETKAAFAKARTGVKRGPMSAEHRRKLSEANRGKHHFKHTPEALEKIAAAGRGRAWSEEARERAAEHARRGWERRRGQA